MQIRNDPIDGERFERFFSRSGVPMSALSTWIPTTVSLLCKWPFTGWPPTPDCGSTAFLSDKSFLQNRYSNFEAIRMQF